MDNTGVWLFSRARRLWGRCDGVCPRTLIRVFRAYGSLSRAYHGQRHVVDVVESVFRMSRGLPAHKMTALLAAAWFHDVVYESRRSGNEERSAKLMAAELRRCGLDRRTIEEAARLILVTKKHTPKAGDIMGKILVDADLATLSARPDRYDAYVAAIRREYAWVPEDAYRAGRAAVLRAFASRASIYQMRRMRRREAAARANIERELHTLE